MKCSNCGFETEDKFCSMCGTSTLQNNNVDNDTAGVNTVPQHSGQQSFQSAPNMQQDLNNINQNAQSFPSIDSAENTNTYTDKKSKSNVLPIVISSVLAVVILSGIVINIVSSAFDKSLTKTLTNMSEETVVAVDDMQFYIDNYGQPHKIGEKVEMSSSSVKIESATIKDSAESFSPINDKVAICLSLMVEITNDADDAIDFEEHLLASPSDDWTINFDKIRKPNENYLDDEYTGSYFADSYYCIEPKQTKTMEYQFAVSKYAETVIVKYIIWNNDSNSYDDCMFEIDISEITEN
ncbi:MAG: zinc ribbon domain-containing protein [Ruminococcus sp.]|nr:zinc ribbon domain-containing protein [Ruminococcus sp.]